MSCRGSNGHDPRRADLTPRPLEPAPPPALPPPPPRAPPRENENQQSTGEPPAAVSASPALMPPNHPEPHSPGQKPAALLRGRRSAGSGTRCWGAPGRQCGRARGRTRRTGVEPAIGPSPRPAQWVPSSSSRGAQAARRWQVAAAGGGRALLDLSSPGAGTPVAQTQTLHGPAARGLGRKAEKRSQSTSQQAGRANSPKGTALPHTGPGVSGRTETGDGGSNPALNHWAFLGRPSALGCSEVQGQLQGYTGSPTHGFLDAPQRPSAGCS